MVMQLRTHWQTEKGYHENNYQKPIAYHESGQLEIFMHDLNSETPAKSVESGFLNFEDARLLEI